jgi:MarR family transcriptional regulator, organic hydroperoxide resistance regulator
MNLFGKDSLEFSLAQVIKTHHNRAQMLLGKLGLYPGQPPILFMLWETDGRTQKEFADKLRLAPATITIMLKRMEKAGLIIRKEDPEDLRVSRVFLTAAGKKIRLKVEDALRTLNDHCFEGFSTEERVLLRRFLVHMFENLSKPWGE